MSGTPEPAWLTHSYGAQCSEFVPMCQPLLSPHLPPFFFSLFWVESNTCSLFVPRLVLFVLFFPGLKTKRFTSAKPLLGGGALFSSAERIVPFSSGEEALSVAPSYCPKMQGFMGHQALWQGTQGQPANPRPFLFIPVQVEKKSLSVALRAETAGLLSIFPSQACPWKLPAAASLDKHRACAQARHSVSPAESLRSSHQSPSSREPALVCISHFRAPSSFCAFCFGLDTRLHFPLDSERRPLPVQ